MIFEVIAGLTILGEGERYSTKNLIGICAGMVVSVSGIFVLGYKKSSMEEEKDDDEENEDGEKDDERQLLIADH